MSDVTMRLEGVLGRLTSRLPGAVRANGQATPAQIMVPRIVYATAATLLVLFGFLMIYSSSSIMALTSAPEAMPSRTSVDERAPIA